MINSEGIIKNKGTYSNGTWSNVVIQPRYPNALPNGLQQNSSSNQLSVNDHIIDNNGFVWKVISCSLSGTDYICSITQQGVTPSATMEPNTVLEKGIVITANSKGLLAPYYHDSYVTTNAFRAAMAYNMNIYSTGGSGGTTLLPGFYTEGSDTGFLINSTNGGLKLENLWARLSSYTQLALTTEIEFTPTVNTNASYCGFFRYWGYWDAEHYNGINWSEVSINANNQFYNSGVNWSENYQTYIIGKLSPSLIAGTKYIIKIVHLRTVGTDDIYTKIYINNVLEINEIITLSTDMIDYIRIDKAYFLCPLRAVGTYATSFYEGKINSIKVYLGLTENSVSLINNFELNNSLACSINPSISLAKSFAYERNF